jgi:Bacterial Ig-like domain (group 3)/Beta-propeller repeat
LQPTNGGGEFDSFVSKLTASGSALVYSTYLGGVGVDVGEHIAADRAGNAYVTGYTNSTDFPTKNALQPAFGGGNGDAFVAKINAAGSVLVYSTYLGGSGSDVGVGIAVDSAGDAYVVGETESNSFPTMNPLQKKYAGNGDAFVTEFGPKGSALLYSTFLGGTRRDGGSSIAIDGSNNAYITGYTASFNFPTKSAFQPAYGGGRYDAFVAKIHIPAATTTTLASSPNPSSYGQKVTFTAAVTSVAGPPPDGETVTFKKGTTILGTGTLSDGTAKFATSTLGVGSPTFTAVYGGDLNFGGSTSKPLKQVVSKATTTTTLASSLNPSKVGQSVTFTARVTPEFGGNTGTVTFYDGTTALKTVYLSADVAKFTTSTLTSGAHTIKATYTGNVDFDGSPSAPLTQTVH